MSLSFILVTAGLVADLIGVLFLGFDVIKIQRNLRQSAQEKFDGANEVLGDYDQFGDWVKEVKRNADWRDWDYEEGQVSYRAGTFDHDAAERSISDIMLAISNVNESLSKIAEITVDGAIQDQHTAERSLKMSYMGLALITIGFALQIVSQLTNDIMI